MEIITNITYIDGPEVRAFYNNDEKEEKISLLAESIQAVSNDSKLSSSLKKATFTIPRGTSKQKLMKLSGLLKSNPGNTEMTLIIENGDLPKRIILPYRVKYSLKLKSKLSNLL